MHAGRQQQPLRYGAGMREIENRAWRALTGGAAAAGGRSTSDTPSPVGIGIPSIQAIVNTISMPTMNSAKIAVAMLDIHRSRS